MCLKGPLACGDVRLHPGEQGGNRGNLADSVREQMINLTAVAVLPHGLKGGPQLSPWFAVTRSANPSGLKLSAAIDTGVTPTAYATAA